MSLLTNNSVDLSCLPSSEGGTEKLKRSKSLLTEQIRCSLISAGILLLSEFKDNIVYLHTTLTRGDVCPFRSNWIKRLFNLPTGLDLRKNFNPSLYFFNSKFKIMLSLALFREI